MSIFRRTHVCFNCMTSCRAKETYTPICPECGKDMIGLCYEIRIPRKGKKHWDHFKKWLIGAFPYYEKYMQEESK